MDKSVQSFCTWVPKGNFGIWIAKWELSLGLFKSKKLLQGLGYYQWIMRHSVSLGKRCWRMKRTSCCLQYVLPSILPCSGSKELLEASEDASWFFLSHLILGNITHLFHCCHFYWLPDKLSGDWSDLCPVVDILALLFNGLCISSLLSLQMEGFPDFIAYDPNSLNLPWIMVTWRFLWPGMPLSSWELPMHLLLLRSFF